jgi:Zn-dependent protease
MITIANAILALCLHELAHLAAAVAMDVRVYQVGMSWRGPFIRREPGTTGQNLTITLAGSGSNLLLAVICHHIHPMFALNNFVLGISNLLPFPSSDGSRALSLLTTISTRFTFLHHSEHERGEGELIGIPSGESREDEAA